MSKTNAFQKVGHKDRRQGQRFYNVTRVFGGSSSAAPLPLSKPSPAFHQAQPSSHCSENILKTC